MSEPINVTIDRIEVCSDDPDRFVMSLQEMLGKLRMGPLTRRQRFRRRLRYIRRAIGLWIAGIP